MGRNLAALALAVIHLAAINCRFVCAMSADPSVAVEMQRPVAHGGNSCHHGDDESEDRSSRRQDHPAPCCMGRLDKASALLPAEVALVAAPMSVSALPALAAEAAIPFVQLRAFSENHDPPPTASETLGRSPLSPRAPPSLLVLL